MNDDPRPPYRSRLQAQQMSRRITIAAIFVGLLLAVPVCAILLNGGSKRPAAGTAPRSADSNPATRPSVYRTLAAALDHSKDRINPAIIPAEEWQMRLLGGGAILWSDNKMRLRAANWHDGRVRCVHYEVFDGREWIIDGAREYFEEDGRRSVVYYKMGEPNGAAVDYDANGKPVIEREFRDGILTATYYFDENGKRSTTPPASPDSH